MERVQGNIFIINLHLRLMLVTKALLMYKLRLFLHNFHLKLLILMLIPFVLIGLAVMVLAAGPPEGLPRRGLPLSNVRRPSVLLALRVRRAV